MHWPRNKRRALFNGLKRDYNWDESRWAETGWTLIRRVEGEFLDVPPEGFFPNGTPEELYNWPEREKDYITREGEYISAWSGEPTERSKWVYVVQPEPLPNVEVVKEPSVPVKQWKPFAAGMLTMLVAASVVVGGWQMMHAADSAQTQLAATLAPLPEGLSTAQLQALQQTSPPPELGISKTQQLLAQLLQLKPDWAVSYGDRLVQQALTLWPEEAKPLAQQWQKQMSLNALAKSDLNGWHEGMTQLQQLTTRLNALDEQKGKYMTVSELKSAVFAMSQSFGHIASIAVYVVMLSRQSFCKMEIAASVFCQNR